MHIAFSGRITTPLTGAELVPIQILRELAVLDRENHYSIFLTEANRAVIGQDSPNLNIITYSDFWGKASRSVLWHQLFLPIAVARCGIDVLFTVQNRIPLIKTCPQVVAVYDLADYHVKSKYDAGRSVYRNFIFKTIVPRADRVMTISHSSKRDIVEFLRIPEERIDVIYVGGSEEFSGNIPKQAAQERVAQRLDLHNDYILYVGAIEHPNKNLVRLLQAYDLIRRQYGITQDLVLAGPDRYRPEVVRAEIERLGLQDCVRCIGYAPKEDLPYLYAGADLFVYVSLWEGFGLPALEAMASGAPVIASNTSSLPEVVGDAGILVDPLNVSEIAAAMQSVLRNPEMQQQLRQLGLARARQFSWKNSARNLLQVFEAIGQKR